MAEAVFLGATTKRTPREKSNRSSSLVSSPKQLAKRSRHTHDDDPGDLVLVLRDEAVGGVKRHRAQPLVTLDKLHDLAGTSLLGLLHKPEFKVSRP